MILSALHYDLFLGRLGLSRYFLRLIRSSLEFLGQGKDVSVVFLGKYILHFCTSLEVRQFQL